MLTTRAKDAQAGSALFAQTGPIRAESLDPDDEELSDESARQPMTFAEAIRRQRGQPLPDQPKQQVSIRLDADLVERLKAEGPGWQGRANDLLRKAVGI